MKWFIPVILLFLFSCSVIPKNYPANRPFVYDTEINLEGNFNTEEKTDILSRLESQLDDSVRVRVVTKFLLWNYLMNPPAYDSLNASKSVTYMTALLTSLGYFNSNISYDTTLRVVESNETFDQLRTYLRFNVTPGKLVRLDSISWNLRHPELQMISDSANAETFLKKGNAFEKPVVSAELDRLVDLFRNRGYMKFTRDEMIGEWDTLDAALLRPTLDFEEQIRLMEELRRRRDNPTADIEIRLKPNVDSARLVKYYIGDVTVYPDYREDSSDYSPEVKIIDNNYRIISYANLFKTKIIPENIYFKRGDEYSLREYVRTINRFNSLGAWKLVLIEQIPRAETDTVDYIIRLTPADKYSFDADIEGSFNTGNPLSGNLFGIGGRVGIQNRNFAKAANHAITNFRASTELSIKKADRFVQTRQISVGHSISFPRILPRFGFIPFKFRENGRTVFSFNLANTDRVILFNLKTINGSWGYETSYRNKLYGVRLFNIEYSLLNRRDSLDRLFNSNKSLKYIFTTGLVSSVTAGVTITGGHGKTINQFRFNAEASGIGILGRIRNNFFDSNLYRFIKFDVDLRKTIATGTSAFAFRVFTGIGHSFYDESRNPEKNFTLPFFKQYFAGGPNSMRAWSLRRLGPGSTIDTFRNNPLRFGDIQFEFNTEYRFYLMRLFGFKTHSAVYTDIGNIWFMRNQGQGLFKFKNFFKDLAVGVGTGLRVDFEFALIRLDYAFKARDPSPAPEQAAGQYKWFYGLKLTGGELQLGINYPF